MTKGEIRIIVFILSALILGALAKHYRSGLHQSPTPEKPASSGWSEPVTIESSER